MNNCDNYELNYIQQNKPTCAFHNCKWTMVLLRSTLSACMLWSSTPQRKFHEVVKNAGLGEIKTQLQVSSCYCSVSKLYPTLCNPKTPACQLSQSFSSSRSLLKVMFIEQVMPSNHLILCSPLFPPSISQHQGLFQ